MAGAEILAVETGQTRSVRNLSQTLVALLPKNQSNGKLIMKYKH